MTLDEKIHLLHGPVAMIDEGFPVILVAPSGLGSDVDKLLAVIEKRKARLLTISDRAEVLERSHARIALPSGVPVEVLLELGSP